MRNSRKKQLKKCDAFNRRWGARCAKEAFDYMIRLIRLVKKKDYGPELFPPESLPRLIAPRPNITLPIERRYLK